METIGRTLMIFGVVLFLIGGGVYLVSRFGLPLGRLPGDIRIERDHFSFYFPIASSIVISVLLTVLLNLLARFWRR